MKEKLVKVFKIVLIFLSLTFFIYPLWQRKNIGAISFEQIIYNIMTNASKGNLDLVWEYFLETSIFYIIGFGIIWLILYSVEKYSKNKNKSKNIVIGVIFFISAFWVLHLIGFFNYVISSTDETTIYDEEYVSPNEVEITFPENKRNLIYIVLESMDRNMANYVLEDGRTINLTPNLSKLEKEYIYFSNEEKNKGMMMVTNTTWTAASLVGQVSGVPIADLYEANQVMKEGEFLPGAVSIGEILKDEGYDNYFIMGSDASFGSRDVFFNDHGNYEMHDLKYQKEKGKLPEDYMVFWGYEDSKLFEYAKEDLLEIAKSDKPFNYTMLTVNTHFMEGYVDEKNPIKYGGYKDAYYYSDKEIYEFIEWIREQDFYENTTIVLVGDHRTMNAEFLENQGELIGLYNLFINADIDPISTSKTSTVLDMFPTTLASLGVEIEGNRLGLGTNLFSDEPTLIERIGEEELNERLQSSSDFYENNFIKKIDD